MTMKRRFVLAGAGLATMAALGVGASATATTVTTWKGGDSLVLTALVPEPGRCGTPSPGEPVFEARLSGTGIDVEGGAFAVTASACFNTETLRVTGLEATDTFTSGSNRGATVKIRSDDFTFERNDASGVIYSRRPVAFRITQATGSLAGTRGHGHYEIALSWPASGGLPQPAHVWFEGEMQRP